ncbi:MAG: toxic anion resistance protein, partial [Ruthenibacterium sp.]
MAEPTTTPALSLDTDPAPTLTLDAPAPVAPSLTLDTAAATPADAAVVTPPPAAVLDESSLSPDEQKAVNDFSEKIDLTNSTQVLQYGASSQKKVADFSSAALDNIRTKDLGEVGGMVTDLITELKGFDASSEAPKGIFGFFKKST